VRTVKEFALDTVKESQKLTAPWWSYHFSHVEVFAKPTDSSGVVQHVVLIVSAIVDDSLKPFERTFLVVQAGDPLPPAANFVGAANFQGTKGETFHVFEMAPYADRPPRPEAPRPKHGSLL
jgi:hypothetical protein